MALAGVADAMTWIGEKVVGVRAARQREAHYIDVYRRLGCALLNTQGMPQQAQLWV